MSKLRSEFDLDPKLIYLNSGTQSISPRIVNDSLCRHVREYDLNPTQGLNLAWPKLWEVQKRTADFFGANPTDLFFRPNVTAALNEFILNAPISKNSEILTSDLEYGAILNIARYRTERDQLKLRKFKLSELKESELIEGIVREFQPHTSMLILSHVVTYNGLRLPILEIAKETRKRGIYLVVDGAHSAGSFDLDFSKFNDVDFYGTNLHKWMMGPKGTSFGWVHPMHHKTLKPLQAGWTTYEIAPPFNLFSDGKPGFEMQFLMLGCHQFSSFFALEEMYDFWKKHGSKNIFAFRKSLYSRLASQMVQHLGWNCLSSENENYQSPLLSFEFPENLRSHALSFAEALFHQERIQVAIPTMTGRPVLRLSPQIYNTEDEIDRSVAAIKKMARRF